MRVTVSHKKTKADVTKIVNDSSDELFRGVPGAPFTIVDHQKRWEGSVMHFSFTGKMGFFSTPLKGTVEVTDNDVTVDCELPGFLNKLIPEEKVRAAVEGKVRGLLSA